MKNEENYAKHENGKKKNKKNAKKRKIESPTFSFKSTRNEFVSRRASRGKVWKKKRTKRIGIPDQAIIWYNNTDLASSVRHRPSRRVARSCATNTRAKSALRFGGYLRVMTYLYVYTLTWHTHTPAHARTCTRHRVYVVPIAKRCRRNNSIILLL